MSQSNHRQAPSETTSRRWARQQAPDCGLAAMVLRSKFSTSSNPWNVWKLLQIEEAVQAERYDTPERLLRPWETA